MRLTQEEFTTKSALKAEKDILQFVVKGQRKYSPVVTDHEVGKLLPAEIKKSERASGFKLTTGQADALRVTLTNTDQFHRWRGVAGAGKTTSMDILRQQYEKRGYVVKGFAPTGDAALGLASDARMKDYSTVAKLLVSQDVIDRAKGKELWIVDEAGMCV